MENIDYTTLGQIRDTTAAFFSKLKDSAELQSYLGLIEE